MGYYGRDLEQSAWDFITNSLGLLNNHQIIELLDSMDLDDLIDYIESTEKFKVLDIKEFEELEALKESLDNNMEDVNEDLEALKDLKLKLSLIIHNSASLEAELKTSNNILRERFNEITKLIENESNSVK